MVTLINIPDASRNWGADMRTNLNNLNTGVEQARTLATAAVPGTSAGNGQVFVKNGSGTLTGIAYSSTATANTVVQRDASGQVNVATTPTATNHSTSKSYVDAQVSAKYTKPSTGIPATDLATAVQTSLGSADTASQPGHTHVSTDVTDSTATGRSLLTAADAATARGTLGAAPRSTTITGTGGLTGGGDLTANRTLDLTAASKTSLAKADTAVQPAALTSGLAGKADLVNGVVPSSQIPAVAISDVFTVASQADMLALTAQRGDVAVRTDQNRTWILSTDDPTALANWVQLPDNNSITSVNGQQGVVVLGKGDVGLGNVDNTSDANKPVSTAQQTALNAKLDTTAANANQVYFRNSSGTPAGLSFGAAVTSSALVQRDASGQINIPTTPTSTTHSTSKAYVDSATADIASGGRLGALSKDVSSTDLNSLVYTGFYRGSALTNSPNGTGWFYVIVQSHDAGNWIAQQATGYTGTGDLQTWTRQKRNNAWNSWVQTADSTGAFDTTARTTANAAVPASTASAGQVFGRSTSGLTGIGFTTAATAGALVQRATGGQVTVPATPSATTDATSKSYVDNAVASAGGGGGSAYLSTEIAQGDLSLTDATDANNLRSWLEIAMDMGPTEYALSRLAPGVSKTLGVESVLPSGNANDEVAINAALARSSSVVLSGRYRLSGAIQIPSHTTLILKDAHLRLEDGLTSNIITNTNLAPNGNSHIRVVGIGRAVLDGNAANQVRSSTESWKNVGVHWVGVSNFQVSGITIRNTSNFSALHVGCSYGSWTNITLDQNRVVVNQDGIDFGPGNSYIFVDGVYGKVEDDVFSIFAKYSTGGGSVHPAFATGGDTHHLYFSNVFIDTFRSLFRMQAAEGSTLHHIFADNCHITSVIRATSFVNFGELKAAYVKGPYPDTAGNDFYAIYLNNMSGRVNTMVRMSTNIKDVFITNLFSDNWQYIYGSGDGEQGNAYNINIDGVVTAYDGGNSYGNVVELDQANHQTDRLSITNMNLARVDRVTFSAMPVTNGILSGVIDQCVTRVFGGTTPWAGKCDITFKTAPPSAGSTPPTNPFTSVKN